MTQQLYNDAILAEAKSAHGNGRLAEPDVSLTCDNPLCGDRVTVDLRLSDGTVTELSQRTRGCLLTQAAASVLGRHAAGATATSVAEVTAQLQRVLSGETLDPDWPELAMFAPVSAIRSRHECVLLPFRTLSQALGGADRS
ncbi:MAG: iron-sulfur cluster assembly scaffold protein [Geminicoccaceae bacterium]